MAHEPSVYFLWPHITTCTDTLHKQVQEDASCSSVAKQHHYPAAGMRYETLSGFVIVYHLTYR